MRVFRGRRLVLGVYLFLVALGGAFGYVLGAIILPQRVDGPLPMARVGPLAFEISPPTLAVYGVVMVGLSLGVFLVAVAYVSNRYVEEAA